MSMRAWMAWAVLVGLWIGFVVYLVDTRGADRLCVPPETVFIRLAQPKGATEPGVVYMDFQAARTARDGLDQWLHEHGRC